MPPTVLATLPLVVSFLLAAAALGEGGCLPRRALPAADAGAESDAGLAAPADAGAAADGGVAPKDGGRGPRPLSPDGGCPPPARITSADLPTGFLAPVRVALRRAIDGDTAHFDFPDGGPLGKALRFLWVNTEESFGDATTAFGVHTSEILNGYLRAASEIVVAPQEDRRRPGQPAEDAYDRWLGVLFVDGELFETRIVREGWSPYYTAFGCAREPIHSALLYAEAEARVAARGVWRPGHPVDYEVVMRDWIGETRQCRPNPYESERCR